MDIASSINGRKILFKKNFFDIQAYGPGGENEKVQNSLQSPEIYSSHYDLKEIYSKKKLDPIKIKPSQ